ncbi:MAG: alpha-amylase family glycosyl hydrolase, partial [Planctomycetaceae bacterium]
MAERIQRRLPVGAEVQPGGGVHFRVWAPRRRKVTIVVEPPAGSGAFDPRRVALTAEPDGYYSVHVAEAVAGSRYHFLLDEDEYRYPDPTSRFQPQGVHRPSEVIDPAAFAWHDADWPGVELHGPILYELHIGTFTPQGTFAAAIEKLPLLADAGVTLIEVMPVADFDGEYGWGYDGVCWFAPTRLYGRPDDFRRFVDEAHRLGMGVILDVVYN